MRSLIAAALFGALAATPAIARQDVALESSVYVERTSYTGDGRIVRRIEPASRLVRGDKVVLVLEWSGDRDAEGFAVTSPIPATLSFRQSGREGEQVSVDGGRSWGELGDLRIREGGETRLASAADVTHVRWRITSREAAQGTGRIAYSAFVR